MLALEHPVLTLLTPPAELVVTDLPEPQPSEQKAARATTGHAETTPGITAPPKAANFAGGNDPIYVPTHNDSA